MSSLKIKRCVLCSYSSASPFKCTVFAVSTVCDGAANASGGQDSSHYQPSWRAYDGHCNGASRSKLDSHGGWTSRWTCRSRLVSIVSSASLFPCFFWFCYDRATSSIRSCTEGRHQWIRPHLQGKSPELHLLTLSLYILICDDDTLQLYSFQSTPSFFLWRCSRSPYSLWS